MKPHDILKFTRGFRSGLCLVAAAGMVRVAADLTFVALSKKAIDLATGHSEGRLLPCVIALAGMIVLSLLCSSVSSRTTELTEAAMKNLLQKRLFDRLFTSRQAGRDTLHTGDILSRLTDDCRLVAESLCRTLPEIAVATLQLIAAFVFLWHFSPTLALTVGVLLPLFMLSGRIFYRRVRAYTLGIRDIESRLQARMQESLQHRLLLLSYRQAARIADALGNLQRERYDLIRRRTDLTVYSRTAVFAGFEAGYLAAFVWGIAGLRNGTVSFGLMTAYLQLVGLIQRPVAGLARLIPGFIQSQAAVSRLTALENMPMEEDSHPEAARQSPEEPTGIRFNDVTFAYPGEGTPVLKHFSHTFPPGSHTAIMGETGAGKSTLLRLITALLVPGQGSIGLFTESGPDEITVSASTRRHIAYVPQGNSLLSGTIRDNLLIGRHDATGQEMLDALHTAAADFVMELPDGLDTVCGEHGYGLSEGQAQRIAIARAILHPGSIMLLDEISSLLDEATETLLMSRLAEKCGDRTIILVTHRPAPATMCHSILRI